MPPHRSLWQPTIETARVQRSQRVIQSRVADDLFWLGRYAERTDWIMRVLRSALQPLRGDSAPRHLQGAARACLEALAMRDGTQPRTPTDGDDAAASSAWSISSSPPKTAAALSTARSTSSIASPT